MSAKEWPHYEFRAMNGTIEIWLDIDDEDEAASAFEQAQAMFNQAEQTLSRFDPKSELSKLNRTPDRWVAVSPLLGDVLKRALDYAHTTRGIFDPTISLALQNAGYDRTFEEVVGKEPSRSFRSPGTYQQVILHGHQVFIPKGIEIDLGGIAKGYTVQLVAEMLAQLGPALVNGSGDIMAIGRPRGMPGWPVGIEYPKGTDRLERTLAVMWLSDQGLATSGVDRRRWGKSSHHIIDPFTQQPADTLAITASVITSDLVDADVYATVSLIADAQAIPDEFALLMYDAKNIVHMNQKMRDTLIWTSPQVKVA